MGGLLMTKQRVRDLTDIMARVLHYQDRGEPNWQEMDYAGTKREYDELPKEIIDRYRNDAKFHAQVQRAVSMVLELDRSAVEPESDDDAPEAIEIEFALRIAKLWRAGKMIGGDEDAVRNALLEEIERLRENRAAEPPAPQICHWRCCTKPMAPGDSYLCAEHRALFGPARNRNGDA
jgi:hypothetical protein